MDLVRKRVCFATVFFVCFGCTAIGAIGYGDTLPSPIYTSPSMVQYVPADSDENVTDTCTAQPGSDESVIWAESLQSTTEERFGVYNISSISRTSGGMYIKPSDANSKWSIIMPYFISRQARADLVWRASHLVLGRPRQTRSDHGLQCQNIIRVPGPTHYFSMYVTSLMSGGKKVNNGPSSEHLVDGIAGTDLLQCGNTSLSKNPITINDEKFWHDQNNTASSHSVSERDVIKNDISNWENRSRTCLAFTEYISLLRLQYIIEKLQNKLNVCHKTHIVEQPKIFMHYNVMYWEWKPIRVQRINCGMRIHALPTIMCPTNWNFNVFEYPLITTNSTLAFVHAVANPVEKVVRKAQQLDSYREGDETTVATVEALINALDAPAAPRRLPLQPSHGLVWTKQSNTPLEVSISYTIEINATKEDGMNFINVSSNISVQFPEDMLHDSERKCVFVSDTNDAGTSKFERTQDTVPISHPVHVVAYDEEDVNTLQEPPTPKPLSVQIDMQFYNLLPLITEMSTTHLLNLEGMMPVSCSQPHLRVDVVNKQIRRRVIYNQLTRRKARKMSILQLKHLGGLCLAYLLSSYPGPRPLSQIGHS